GSDVPVERRRNPAVGDRARLYGWNRTGRRLALDRVDRRAALADPALGEVEGQVLPVPALGREYLPLRCRAGVDAGGLTGEGAGNAGVRREVEHAGRERPGREIARDSEPLHVPLIARLEVQAVSVDLRQVDRLADDVA